MVPTRTCTWLSFDGGFTWSDIAEGTWIYEYADWGGLVVMSKHELNGPADEVCTAGSGFCVLSVCCWAVRGQRTPHMHLKVDSMPSNAAWLPCWHHASHGCCRFGPVYPLTTREVESTHDYNRGCITYSAGACPCWSGHQCVIWCFYDCRCASRMTMAAAGGRCLCTQPCMWRTSGEGRQSVIRKCRRSCCACAECGHKSRGARTCVVLHLYWIDCCSVMVYMCGAG
jgi:hypothetical protein